MVTSELNYLLASISDEDSATICGGAGVAIDVNAMAQGQQYASTSTDAYTFAYTIPSITIPTRSSTPISFGGNSIAIGYGISYGVAID